MKKVIATKLKEAQDTLGLEFPKELFDFIAKQKKWEVAFGEEEWMIPTVEELPEEENYIVARSLDFKEHWSLDGLVFADNGIGDYLVVLPKDLGDTILVLMHETAELKLFAKDIRSLVKKGPVNYMGTDHYYFRLNEDNELERNEGDYDPDAPDPYLVDYDLRSRIDDLIDDGDGKKISEILEGL